MRVVVVDDNPVVRLAVPALLTGRGPIELVAGLAAGPNAVAEIRALRPAVVLLDVRTPAGDGLAVISQVAGYARVVVLSGAADPGTVLDAIGAGASGYLVHGAYGTADLVGAVLDAARGQSSASPVAVAAMVRMLRRSGRPAAPGPSAHAVPAAALSTRECEVMGLVADGLTNEDIARRLGLTGKTVKNYLQNVYGKLGVHSRSGALSVWFGTVVPNGWEVGSAPGHRPGRAALSTRPPAS